MTSYAGTMAAPAALSTHARRMYRGGIWLIVLAESMIFVTLFSIRFLLAGPVSMVTPGEPLTVFITVILALSLIPAWLAKKRIAAGDAAAMSRNLLLASLLGFAALAAMVFDWSHLGFSAATAFGENYVISTGYHAVHVLIGVLWLFSAGIAGFKGVHTRENHWVVEGGVVFWSFVVALWFILYIVFFVL